MIHSADLIYLGGGNYIHMLTQWKEYELNEKLLSALRREHLLRDIALVLCVGSHLVSDRITRVLAISRVTDGVS